MNQTTVTLTGKIQSYEKKKSSSAYLISSCVLTVQGQNLSPDCKFYMYTDDDTLPIGSIICATGNCAALEPARNNGQFDSESYYRQKGAAYLFYADEITGMKEKKLVGIREAARRCRKKMAGILDQICDEDTASVLDAMLLGDKTEISTDTQYLFQTGGFLHVLTVSGMHMTLLGMGLYELLSRFALPQKGACAITAAVMLFYLFLTGAGTASLRAGVMFFLLLGGKLLGRTYDSPTALAAAVFWLLLTNPLLLQNSSFQLSVAATFGTAVIVPAFTSRSDAEQEAERISLKKRRYHNLEKKKKKVLSAVSFAWILNAVMTPVILWYFYELPLYSLLTSVVLVPTVSFCLLPAACGLLAGCMFLPAGKLLILPASLLLKAYFVFLKLVAALPCSTLTIGRPKFLSVLLYYTALLLLSAVCWFPERKPAPGKVPGRVRKRVMLCLPLLMLLLLPVARPSFSVSLLDVGQGDCILVRSGQSTCMIDGGSTDEKNCGTYRIAPCLKAEGVGELKAVFLTHTDADHISGVEELLDQIAAGSSHLKIDGLYIPCWMENHESAQELLEKASAARVPVYTLQRGDVLTIGKSRFTVLLPDAVNKDTAYQEDVNNGSLVLKLENGTFTGLFMGDLPRERENLILQEVSDCDFLKVGHHGSDTASGELFLKAASPKISMFSCGVNNRYGHPHKTAIQRLLQCGSTLYGTVKSGELTFYRKGKHYYVKGYLNTSPYLIEDCS